MAEKEISKGLRYTFLIGFCVATIFGLTFLLFIEGYVALIGWPYLDPAVAGVLGASLLGWALLALLMFYETDWEKVKKVLLVEVFWHLLGAIVCLIAQFLYTLPATNWIHTIVFLIFFIAYGYFYFTERK